MENNVPKRLAGCEIHGFRTMEDLEVEKIKGEAMTRWLRPNEIHAILCNCTYFTIHVKPVNLPKSGTILLFDRKMLRNFRKDGHNWKKKKDGKTVKEAHEHLKVGNLERIHVYYAHGQDNPNFVRRCYWLLDKEHESIVLVHYRETIELQGSSLTPLNSNFDLTYSDTSTSRVLSEDTDYGADHACYASSGNSHIGKSIDFSDIMTVTNHESMIHEINTLEWEDLVVANDPNKSAAPKNDNGSCFEQQIQHETSDSLSNGNLVLFKNIPEAMSPFGHQAKPMESGGSFDVKLPSAYFRTLGNQMSSEVQGKNFEMVAGGMDESLNMYVKDSLQTQDSFGRWMDYIMIDSTGSLDNLPAESPVSTGHESSTSTVMDPQSYIQEKIFTITDISPDWAFSTEETKVIVVGHFHAGHSHLAESNLNCVFGDTCVPAQMVQVGVFRSMALPCTPGLVNFYLSLDGHSPISQVISFEYRSPSTENAVASPEDKWEECQVQIRLAHLLFSTTKICDTISRNLPPNALIEAKKIAMINSSTKNDWAHLIKSIGNNAITSPQAKNSLVELTLKTKLQVWLLERMVEGCKTTVRDHQGLGVIHLCVILDYKWAVRPYSLSGLSLDFRDAFGWTALHWAAYYGREAMVVVLLSAGADPSLVTDPTSEFPGGCTAADLAAKKGYTGLAAYLAEKGLTAHFRRMSLSGNISGSLQTSTNNEANPGSLKEEQQCLKDMLVAYRNAADAATRIQAAFRERSLKLQMKAIQSAKPEAEARNIIAAMKIQHAFRNYETRKRMGAAARIQQRFRNRKIRKDFLNMRRQAIKIQATFRGHLVRKQYRKILWSVGILEKAILRWRLKRKGFRGFQVKPTEDTAVDQTYENVEEDFYRVSRKQAEDRVERSLVRVKALFGSDQAQQEYRRMKLAYDQAQNVKSYLNLKSELISEGTSDIPGAVTRLIRGAGIMAPK